VTALEPDASGLVGAGAIRMLAREAGLSISVVEQPGEQLPFPSRSFDLVHGRQVLHHAADLTRLCREVARVLKPGGRMIATREHVITRPSDLPVFLDSHPLHKLYGGEQAYLVSEYVAAITGSGLAIGRILGPFDSAINYFPMSHSQWRRYCLEPLTWVLGERLAARVVDDGWPWGPWVLGRLARIRSAFCDAPGRLYTFLADRAR
jgi:SAM-dependent methyltransferase